MKRIICVLSIGIILVTSSVGVFAGPWGDPGIESIEITVPTEEVSS